MCADHVQGFVNQDNEAFMAELAQRAHNNDSNEPFEHEPVQEQPARKGQQVNVFDYEVAEFDNERSVGQEMQEKTGSSLLGASNGNATNTPAVSRALDDDSEWNAGDEDEQMTDHVESVKAPEAQL